MEVKIVEDLQNVQCDILIVNKFENKETSNVLVNEFAPENFTGKKGQIFIIHTQNKYPAKQILAIGFGEEEKIDNNVIRENTAKAIKKCSQWLVYYGATGSVLSQVAEEENIQVAHEVHLEKIYDNEANIVYSAKDLENTAISIQRLKDLLNNSQVTNNVGGKTVVQADTIHFSNKLSNVKELVIQAGEIVTPLPYNYMNAAKSGWVD